MWFLKNSCYYFCCRRHILKMSRSKILKSKFWNVVLFVCEVCGTAGEHWFHTWQHQVRYTVIYNPLSYSSVHKALLCSHRGLWVKVLLGLIVGFEYKPSWRTGKLQMLAHLCWGLAVNLPPPPPPQLHLSLTQIPLYFQGENTVFNH